MKWTSCLFLLFITVACVRDQTSHESAEWFGIEIIGLQDMDCGLPEIIFTNKQNEAFLIIGDSKGIYVASGLPKVNYQPGDRLEVKIRKPEGEEIAVCRALGLGRSQVTITRVR